MDGKITVDTIYVNIKGAGLRALFERYYVAVQAGDLRRGVVVGGVVVTRGVQGYKLGLHYGNTRLYITDRVSMGAWLQCGSDVLADGIESFSEIVHHFLRKVGLKGVYTAMLTRIDLAIDVFELDMEKLDIYDFWFNWVGRSKLTSVWFNAKTGKLETMYIGSRGAPIMLRIYDKVAEAKKEGDIETWYRIWGKKPQRVVRFEYEILVKQASIVGFESIMDVNSDNILGILHYLMSWGRLCVDNGDKNRARWPNSELWQELTDFISSYSVGVDWGISRSKDKTIRITQGYIDYVKGALSSSMAKLSEDQQNLSLNEVIKSLNGRGVDYMSLREKARLDRERLEVLAVSE